MSGDGGACSYLGYADLMSMTFGGYLAACMQAAGYPTPASLSRATGISEGVLSRWLNDKGTAQPQVDTLRRLEPVLHVPLIELMVAAEIVTWQEARLDGPPQPPKPVDTEAIDSMIDNSAMTDDAKAQLRAELERLRRRADETEQRSSKSDDRSLKNGANDSQKSA